MPIVQINYLAVLAAAVASMVIGFLWYGPLFGKPWMALMGWSEKDMEKKRKDPSMGKTYAVSFLGAIVMAYVLSHFANYAGAASILGGAQLGFWLWLGFVGPVQLTDVLFGGKNIKLFLLNTGYQLVSLIVMGALVAVWV